MKKLFLLFMMTFVWLLLFTGTAVSEDWLTVVGGPGSENSSALIRTSDNGYAIAGSTNSFGAGYYDVLIMKLNRNGNILWQKAYGGADNEYAFSIIETTDKGLLVIGRTESFGAGKCDVLVLKVDADGNIQWQKVFGGSAMDWGRTIVQTKDGGYVFCGHTASFGSGNYDFWVVKLESDGEIEWEKTYGGPGYDIAVSISQTEDNGYIVAGYTSSFGSGKDDILVLKLNGNGTVSWQKTYGTASYDWANLIQQTSDNGYIVAGGSQSGGLYPSALLLKLDKDGNLSWQKSYDGSNVSFFDLEQTAGGSFVVYGSILSDMLIFKADQSGNILWKKNYGGERNDIGSSLSKSFDGGLIVTGVTYSFGSGNSDIWIQNMDVTDNVYVCENIENDDLDIDVSDSSLSLNLAALSVLNTLAEAENAALSVTSKTARVFSPCFDKDSDGITDDIDNCPDTYNPEQTDADQDGTGDSCSALYETRESSFVSLTVAPQMILLGEEVFFSGSVISQDATPISGAEVHVTIVSPSGMVTEELPLSLSDGMFETGFTPDEVGGWIMIASWEGNSEYKGALSASAELTVGKANVETDLTLTTLDVSRQAIVLGEEVAFLGTVTTQDSAPIFGALVEVTIISPSGRIDREAEYTTSDGIFDLEFVPDEAGTWTAVATWEGNAGNNGSHSKMRDLTVGKADVALTISLSSKTVLTGSSITVEGYLTPEPANSFPKTGMTVFLNVTGPDEDILIPLKTESSGRYSSPPLNIFSHPGIWTLRSVFAGNSNYLSDITDAETLNVLLPEETGYAIIIQGKIENEEGLLSHKKSLETVYNILAEREVRPENIKVFGYDIPEGIAFEAPLRENIDKAITEWAVGKISDVPAPVYIILIGHGSDERFYIYPEYLDPFQLDSWVSQLESAMASYDFTENPVYMIISSCGSGSFIPVLSGPGRVIITSSAEEENAYRGPLEDTGEREGAYFLSEFFNAAAQGKSLDESFTLAAEQIEIWTEDKTKNNSYGVKFNDNAQQHPLIDDNGDGEGHNYVSPVDGEDGSTQPHVFLGTSDIKEQLEFLSVSPQIYLEPADGLPELYAVFNDPLMLDVLWLEIKTPDYSPLYGPVQQEQMNDFTRIIYDPANTEENLFYFDDYGECDFKKPGAYKVFYFAKDLESGRLLPFQRSVVYRKKAFNFAPARFNLVSPADGSTQDGTLVLLDWETSMDFFDPNITYSLLVSDNETFDSLIFRKDQISESAFVLELGKDFEDGKNYYWKVEAVDSYGEIRESDQTWSFYKDSSNIVPGTLSGWVKDAVSGLPLPNVQVTTNSGWPVQSTSILGGFSILASAGSFNGQARAFGYKDTSFNFKIVAGKTTYVTVAMKKAGSIECPAERAIQDTKTLDLLRSYRDTVLDESEKGRSYVSAYYNHSGEVAKIFTIDIGLRRQFAGIVLELFPEINRAVKEKKKIRLLKHQKKKIRSFLRKLRRKSSPELKRLIRDMDNSLK